MAPAGCLLAAMALSLSACTPSLAFAPRLPALWGPPRVSALSLRMCAPSSGREEGAGGGPGPRGVLAGLRSRVRAFFRSWQRDALDRSWSSQSVIKSEQALAREREAIVTQQGGNFASQMMMLQSMNTKRHLLQYQLHEQIEGHMALAAGSGQLSFADLYSELCTNGEGSLPYCETLRDASVRQDAPSNVRHDQDSTAGAAGDAAGCAAPTGDEGALGSKGVVFLAEMMAGVPDLATDMAPDSAPPQSEEAARVPPRAVHGKEPGERKDVQKDSAENSEESSFVGSFTQRLASAVEAKQARGPGPGQGPASRRGQDAAPARDR